MKQGLLFLLPAIGLACAGIAQPSLPVRLLAFWAAGSFLCVAAGYFGLGGRVFGKRPDGTLSPIGLLAFAPYLVLALIVAAACRWTFREPACQQIAERLYFGRRLLGREGRLLDQRSVVAVLDLTAATPEPAAIRAGRAYRNLPLLDATAPSLEVLCEAVRWIVEQAEDGAVYVHCAAGHGRAGLIAGAYLLATGEAADADESIAKMRRVRPHVWLSGEQRRRLDEYADTREVSQEQPQHALESRQ
jgi:protein-tyrosine phosphatase